MFVYFVCFMFICQLHMSYVIVTRWGGPNGIEVQSLGPYYLQCSDTVGWVILPEKPSAI